MEVETVLVPVDGSDESAEAAEYAVAIARRYGAALHVLYVLGEGVERALRTGDLDGESVADEHRGFVGELRGMAVEAEVGFSVSTAVGFSATSKRHHPGSVTLDTAEDVDADFIVIPREPAGEGSTVLEKAAEYVLLYASQPVLSV
ncbi:MAG: universal stress protein [Halobacteriaceae archaeon]